MNIELYKSVLKQNKMTYEDLAKKTGISRGCIARIMAGIARYPRIDTIETIENALGIKDYNYTQEEQTAGATATRKESITPIEDELLYTFRQVGKKHGEETQKAIITMIEKML